MSIYNDIIAPKEVAVLTTKERILALLEENKGIYFSGEQLAKELQISRTAVWKAINTLRQDGYNIDALSNKGYCLSKNTDILSVQGIKKYLNHDCNNELEVHSQVTSTNDLLREKEVTGICEGYTVIANCQTKGKGRNGRVFYSPSDSGIYMSILLRPQNFKAYESAKITTMAAVAVCEAIEEETQENVGIKWVNDIYMQNKKVCGILTEASLGLENGLLDYVIVGIGMNIYQPKGGFPNDIKEIAGSLLEKSKDDVKNRMVASILNKFMNYYYHGDEYEYIKKYRDHSCVIGKPIQIILPNQQRYAKVLDIDDHCRLIVRYENGEIEKLSSGEISIRLDKKNT